MNECVIAGAGISGLALAWQLRKRGIDSLVLESSARPGGKLRSQRSDGFLCEWGPASFRDQDEQVRRLIGELHLEERLLRAGPASRRRCVVVEGRMLPVPTSRRSFLASPLLPWTAKVRATLDLVLRRGPAGRDEEESLAVMARRRLGRRGAERLLFPLTSGIYAGDLERVSAPSALPWLSALERDRRSLLLGLENVYREEERVGGTLVSFEDGIEEMVVRLAALLGDGVACSSPVEAVERAESTWRLQVGGAAPRELQARTVVLATPAPSVARVLRDHDADLAATVAGIEYVPLALVQLGYAAAALPRPLDTYGLLVPPGEPADILGAIFPSAFFPRRAPEGHALIMTRMGGSRRGELLEEADERLVARAAAAVAKFIGVQAEPRFARVFRHQQALPQYHLGHRQLVAKVDEAERRHPGLYLTGNAYRGLGVADCIHNAALLAERMARELGHVV